METNNEKQLQKKQRTSSTLTFRLARGDKRKIDLLKAHYRQVSAGAAIKLCISDAVDRINKSRDTLKLSEKVMDSYKGMMEDKLDGHEQNNPANTSEDRSTNS